MEIEKMVIWELYYTLFEKSISLSLYMKLYWFSYLKKREKLQWIIEIKMQTHDNKYFWLFGLKKNNDQWGKASSKEEWNRLYYQISLHAKINAF